jgi:protein-disulfide isomerase
MALSARYSMRRAAGVLAVLVVIAFSAGYWAGGLLEGGQRIQEDEPPLSPTVAPPGPLSALSVPRGARGGAPALGAEHPKVVIFWLDDLSTPDTAGVLPTLARLIQEHPETVQLVWHSGPPRAPDEHRRAALAARAAYQQGRFWEFLELLHSAAEATDEEILVRYAERLALDRAQFDADRADAATARRVAEELAVVAALEVAAAPTFFFNGRALVGVRPYEDFHALLAEAELYADQALAAGTALPALHDALATLQHPQGQRFVQLLVERRSPDRVVAPPPTGPSPSADDTVWYVPLAPDSPQLGAADPIVHLVVFADFACPFTQALVPTLQAALALFPEDLRLEWRNNPRESDGDGWLAAEAALVAHSVGRFWELAPVLLDNQGALARADIDRYAADMGLDLRVFGHALDARVYRERVAADRALAERLQIRATPQMYVNGRALAGARPLDEIRALVAEEMERAERLMARGAARRSVYMHLMRGAQR